MDLVNGVVFAANPSVVAALSFRTDFSTREFRMVFSARLRRNDQARASDRWETHTRPITQYLAGVVAWSGTDPVGEGANTNKE